jgi:hypothetical protein
MCRPDTTKHRDRDVPTDVHTPAVDGDHRDAATGRVWVPQSLGYPPAGSMKSDQRIHLYGVPNTD